MTQKTTGDLEEDEDEEEISPDGSRRKRKGMCSRRNDIASMLRYLQSRLSLALV
jgi:hypothetical protein